jgi:hypothetical protein
LPIIQPAKKSRHLDQVLAGLDEAGLKATVETVDYEFQRNGNQLLRVKW